ncbi:hypothetical protein PR048_008192 [Dryococelus australis]|uniref:Uncharacterized protein n=1 Tax=Dryococelus australis TaxID=614101 RepID=A0ABQ9HXA7_9NEOP|nr:hypothetical protein PR048_008192 [Dryococelus australis]
MEEYSQGEGQEETEAESLTTTGKGIHARRHASWQRGIGQPWPPFWAMTTSLNSSGVAEAAPEQCGHIGFEPTTSPVRWRAPGRPHLTTNDPSAGTALRFSPAMHHLVELLSPSEGNCMPFPDYSRALRRYIVGEEIWVALNIEVLEPMRVKRGEYGASLERKGGGNGRCLTKPIDQRHRSARFPHAKIRERSRKESNLVHLGWRSHIEIREGSVTTWGNFQVTLSPHLVFQSPYAVFAIGQRFAFPATLSLFLSFAGEGRWHVYKETHFILRQQSPYVDTTTTDLLTQRIHHFICLATYSYPAICAYQLVKAVHDKHQVITRAPALRKDARTDELERAALLPVPIGGNKKQFAGFQAAG